MFPQFKTILVATDFSQTSEHALEYARALAASFGGTLHLLHVVPDPVTAVRVVGSVRVRSDRTWRAPSRSTPSGSSPKRRRRSATSQ